MSSLSDLVEVLCIPLIVRSASVGDFYINRKLRDFSDSQVLKVKALPSFLRTALARSQSAVLETVPVSSKIVLESQCTCRKRLSDISYRSWNMSESVSSSRACTSPGLSHNAKATRTQNWTKLRREARNLISVLKQQNLREPLRKRLTEKNTDWSEVLRAILAGERMTKKAVEAYFSYLESWNRQKNANSECYRIFPVDFSLKVIQSGHSLVRSQPLSFPSEKWLFPLFTTHWSLLEVSSSESTLLLLDPSMSSDSYSSVFRPFLRFLRDDCGDKWTLQTTNIPLRYDDDGLAICEEARALITRQRQSLSVESLRESVAEDLAVFILSAN